MDHRVVTRIKVWAVTVQNAMLLAYSDGDDAHHHDHFLSLSSQLL